MPTNLNKNLYTCRWVNCQTRVNRFVTKLWQPISNISTNCVTHFCSVRSCRPARPPYANCKSVFLLAWKPKRDILNVCFNKSGIVASYFYCTNDICRLLKHMSRYLTIKCCDSSCSWIIENTVCYKMTINTILWRFFYAHSKFPAEFVGERIF